MPRFMCLIDFQTTGHFIRGAILANIEQLRVIKQQHHIDNDEIEMIVDFSVARALEEILKVPVLGCASDLDTWRIFYKSHIRHSILSMVEELVFSYGLDKIVVNQLRQPGNRHFIKILTTDFELVFSYQRN